jgi:hypothetical protein
MTTSDTIRHSLDSSSPPILSAPPMTPAEIETLIDSKFHATYQTTFDSFSTLSASVAALHLQHSTSPTTSLSTSRSTGFFQKESKDFHVSKLVKLLELEVLHSDSLQDLEIFFDSILSHFNTVALTTDLYPRYRDLPLTFDFYCHLCQLDCTVRPSPMDQAQGLANYKSFGTGLHRFLLNPKTFSQETCPESYLQLLSLRNEPDGFIIIRHFTFLRSPQLDGKYRDFRSAINNLIIYNNKHLRTFYGRTTWLSNEIQLAQLHDGTLAVLFERFLALLRGTNCHLIIGETSTFWRQIREHRRNPTNLSFVP